jgi:hypothetical protein
LQGAAEVHPAQVQLAQAPRCGDSSSARAPASPRLRVSITSRSSAAAFGDAAIRSASQPGQLRGLAAWGKGQAVNVVVMPELAFSAWSKLLAG